jgi:23S rRNA pseudouridine955/2504/2580 synthase
VWVKIVTNQTLKLAPPVKHIIVPKPPPLNPQVQTVCIDADQAGQRLDNFLFKHLKGVPKTHVYRIIRSGEVRVNKSRVDADYRVLAGDALRIPPVRISERVQIKAEAMRAQSRISTSTQVKPLDLLHEDDHFLVVNKPAGIAVHGGSGVSFGVIEQLRMARPQAKFLELVHRLDRETSGILLVAKKRSALNHLQQQFRERETGKTYLALVVGTWSPQRKVLNKPLHKYLLPGVNGLPGERRVKVVTPDDPDGMPALTLVQRLAVFERDNQAYSLLAVTIKTGRTHQIRVHLAAEGMPIVGDDKYGDFELNKRLARLPDGQTLRRMFLHAWQFQCNHPQTGVRMQFACPLALELAQFVAPALTPELAGMVISQQSP